MDYIPSGTELFPAADELALPTRKRVYLISSDPFNEKATLEQPRFVVKAQQNRRGATCGSQADDALRLEPVF